jgi:hypothetical protein
MKELRRPSPSGEDVVSAASQEVPYHSGVQLLLAQAMQASSHAMNSVTARQHDGRLIAMSRIRSHSLPLHDFGLYGFAESEPDSLAIKPAREGRSAKENPQVYGKPTVTAFDMAGFVSWLRRRFRRYTAVSVEAATGISSASVENWLQLRSQPSVEHFAILVSTFGPSVMRAALRHDAEWLAKAEAEAIAAELEDEIRALEQRRLEILRRAGA